MSGLWLPSEKLEVLSRDEAARRLGPDDLKVLPAESWGRVRLRERDGVRRRVPAVGVVDDDLEEAVLRGVATGDAYGIAVEWAGEALREPMLWLRLDMYHLGVFAGSAPPGWVSEAVKVGWAVTFPKSDDPAGATPYLAVGPMQSFPRGIVLPPTRRAKTGRNALCPCGSGLKFKRCHGDGRVDG